MLIYDGDCSFCTACANWAAARWRDPVRRVPWQALGADELAAFALTGDQVRCAAWWIDETGGHFRGHLAIAQALRAGSGWSAALGQVLFVPPFRWVGAASYPVIARARHRLPGGTPACRM